MSDLIDRQAAIDALDEEPMVWNDNDEYTLGERAEWRRNVDALKNVPSAQPEIISTPSYTVSVGELMEYAPIVRCKNCKYMTEHYDTDGNAPYWTCSEWDSGTDYEGFCHYAERRTDE